VQGSSQPHPAANYYHPHYPIIVCADVDGPLLNGGDFLYFRNKILPSVIGQ
jgi:hypothetical protein